MLYPLEFGNDPLYPQENDFQVVEKNDLSGKGVFSKRAFKKGRVIAKMAGPMVPDIRQHTLQIDEITHLYDTYFSGYFLHSCDPNISLNMRDLTVTALKNIPENTFLYMDYAETEHRLYKQFPCNCGTRRCRGWITGNKELGLAEMEVLSFETFAGQ